jgi:hypothetical protein
MVTRTKYIKSNGTIIKYLRLIVLVCVILDMNGLNIQNEYQYESKIKTEKQEIFTTKQNHGTIWNVPHLMIDVYQIQKRRARNPVKIDVY